MARASTGQYPPNWPEIARSVKEGAGWKCVRCGHPHNVRAKRVLTVHHLDMNPANNEWWNIPALCQVCHLHIQAKVIMERPWMFEHSEWFKPYAAGFYAMKYLGQKLAREEVMDRIDELLALEVPSQEAGRG